MHFERWLPSHAAAAVLLLLVAGAGFVLPRVTLDTRVERMVMDDDEAVLRYDEFKEVYGQDDIALIAVSGMDLFDYDGLDAMAETMDLLLESERISMVSGLPQVFMDLYGGEDADLLKEEMTTTPFYHGFFISKDATMAGIVASAANLSEPGARPEFVRDVEAAIQPLVDHGYTVDIVGAIVIAESLREMAGQEARRFFPFAIGLSLLILLGLLRSFRAALVVILCGAATIMLTLATLTLLGKPLNVVTQAFPLILWMLTLAGCLHVVTRYQHFLSFHGDGDHTRAAKASIEEIAVAVAISGLTTALGFSSLGLSAIPHIKEFGYVMAGGMVVSVVVNLVLSPWLLVVMRTPIPRYIPLDHGERFVRLGRMVLARPWLWIVTFMILVVVGAWSFTQVRTEKSTLSFLPDDSPSVISFYRAADKLAGMYTMEVLVNTPGGWLNQEYWKPIDAMAKEIEGLDEVSRVITPLDSLRKIRQWDLGGEAEFYALPESEEEAAALARKGDDEESGGIRRLVREDDEQIRMTAILSTAEANNFLAIYDRINVLLEELPEPLNGLVTGRATQMQQMQSLLIDSQRKSFSLAFVLVFGCMLIGLGSFRLLLVSIVPNIMPILSTFTVMILLDIPLDAGTVMVASIALGIAVDDTVHILAGYKRHRALRENNEHAILEAMQSVGPPITVSSLTISIGFFILALSVFKPLAYLGAASGIAILMALLSDLFFVPALLKKFGASGPEPETEST